MGTGRQVLASALFLLGLFVLLGVTGTSDFESLYPSFSTTPLPFWQSVLLSLCGLGLASLGLIILSWPNSKGVV